MTEAQVEPVCTSKQGVIADFKRSTEERTAHPTIAVLRSHWAEVLLVTATAAFWTCSYYTSFVWMAYFMSQSTLIGEGNQSMAHIAWALILAANLCLVVLLPLCGMLGDIVGREFEEQGQDHGRRLTMQAALLLMMLIAWPAFYLISHCTVSGAVTGVALLLFPVALYGANLPAFMVAQFPRGCCYSGVGIGKYRILLDLPFASQDFTYIWPYISV